MSTDLLQEALEATVQARVDAALAEERAELADLRAKTNEAVAAAVESHLVNIRLAVRNAIVALQELSI